MIKQIAMIVALVSGLLFVQAPEVHATGFLGRAAARAQERQQNRQEARAQRAEKARQAQKARQQNNHHAQQQNNHRVVERVIQNNYHHNNQNLVERVVVDRYGRVVERSVVVQKNRNLRIVEVPNLDLHSDLIITRDKYGRILDIKRRNVVETHKQNYDSKGKRIIVEQNINKGY